MEKKRPSVVVGTYIISRGKLLLIKNPKWGNQWMVPGGHVEYKESLVSAAIRESREEVGLKVKPLGVIAIGEEALPETFKKKKHFIYFEMICNAQSSKVRMDGREVLEYRWFGLNEALRAVEHKLLKRVIREYIRQKKSGTFKYIDTSPE